MAVEKSTEVTNATASPVTKNDAARDGGRVRGSTGAFEVTTDVLDGTDDVILLARVPTNAVISKIIVGSDDLDSDGTPALAVDVGIFEEDGTAKDKNYYATAVTDFQAAFDPKEFQDEARPLEDKGQHLWEDAGDTEDPGGYYYIGLGVETAAATAAAGTVAYEVIWTAP